MKPAIVLSSVLSVAAAPVAAAAEPAAEIELIRDNLFLLEEAYNQEPGVIQHIQGFVVEPKSGALSYTFTEEWPMPLDHHQLSLTLAWSREASGAATRFGDLLLNYRYQAIGAGGAGWLALAPRLSLVVPTGDYRAGAGRGAMGLQANIPVSIELNPTVVLHVNAGGTMTPSARSPGGKSANLFDAVAGLAVIWLPLSWANAFVEVSEASVADVGDDQRRTRTSVTTVSPALRFAWNATPGLQVVPGVAMPVQRRDGETTVSVLGYLSIEHVLWHPEGALSPAAAPSESASSPDAPAPVATPSPE
ncbi:MAG: transporter [Deltaproteobacteria bacterium]|nr:transporter [Deltaproteobacteria bacterium]